MRKSKPKIKKENLRVIAYTRVSTKEQAEQGVSLDDQLNQIKRYCKQHGHRVVATYVDDGYSGREEKRPQFTAMAEAIMSKKLQADAIFTLTVSRFFRDAYLSEFWKRDFAKRGVNVVHICEDVGEGMSSNFMTGILALKAQHDSEVTGFLTSRGMKENASQGYYNGGGAPPYGYRVVRLEVGKHLKSKIVMDDDEAKVVRRIFSIA